MLANTILNWAAALRTHLKIALCKLGCHELALRKAKFLFCMSLWVGGLYGWAKTGPHAAPRPWEDGVGRGQKTLLLAILGDTWRYLVILGNTWWYLGTEDSTLDNIWQFLAILGDRSLYSLKYLVILPSIWLSLWIQDSTLGNTLQYLAIFGDIWQYLVMLGGTWWYLMMLNNSWWWLAYLAIFDKIEW